MKRFIVCLAAAVVSVSLMAQKAIGVYHSSYFNKDYEVSVSYSSSNEPSVYIQVSGERTGTEVNMSVKGEQIAAFSEALTQVKEKYAEWQKVAKENNVTDMSKAFDIVFPRVTIAWYGSKWWFDFNHRLSPRFLVTKTGECVFVMTGKATASSNEYITEKYYFALAAESDFDELLKLISPSSIEAKRNAEQNVQDLFK